VARATRCLVILSGVLVATPSFTLRAQQPGTRPVSNTLPSVSPDGSRILFLSDRQGANGVFLISAAGGEERPVTDGPVQRARWAADGREILLAGGGADSGRVVAVATDGGNRRIVATVAGRSPVLSPDGKLVAYLVGPWTSTAIAVANADGSGAKVIAGGRTTAWNPAWSPDSKRIAYTYGDSSRVLQVHLVNADGTGDSAVTHVTGEEGSAQVPAWSFDGQRLAVQVSNGRSRSAHIWIVDLKTGHAQQLAPHAEPYLEEAPAWFPNGERIAFQSTRSGRMEIWVMKDDGSEQRQLTSTPR
jgi:TolB protein